MAHSSSRDEFSRTVKDTLAKRVGHRCSNPACMRATTGPDGSPNGTVCTGVACHISAAAPGGPRYRPDLSNKDRSSERNGLWLCQYCSRLIDRDLATYTELALQNWKAAAVDVARAVLSGGYSPFVTKPVTVVAEGFEAWRQPEGLIDEVIVVISQWDPGDFHSQAVLRFKNWNENEIILRNLRIEFFGADNLGLLASDGNAFKETEIRLAGQRFTDTKFSSGLRQPKFIEDIESVWLRAEVFGDERVFRWKLVDFYPGMMP